MINSPTKRLITYGPGHLISFLTKGHFNGPLSFVIEITNRCNLNCPLCYWKTRPLKKELNDKEWERKVNKILSKYPGILRVIWAGGEPMLRLGLIKNLSKNFLHNTIVTNGTIPLEKIKNTEYRISIDGTKEFHEKQRGDYYEIIKKNIKKSKVNNIVVNCLISKLNSSCLEDFIEEWSKIKNVKRIKFSFYTPNKDSLSKNLWLNHHERDRVIERLSAASKKHSKLLKDIKPLRSLLSSNYQKSIRKCHVNPPIFLDANGNRLYNQLLKEKSRCNRSHAECSKCGHPCLIKAGYISKHRLATLKNILSAGLR